MSQERTHELLEPTADVSVELTVKCPRSVSRIGLAQRSGYSRPPGDVGVPIVSVIIPVFNEVRTIDELLQRVVDAPYCKQIIVVDDGSTDGSVQKLAAWSIRDGIEVRSHRQNRGKGAAIRTGLEYATAEYTIIQDADLEYDPGDYPRLIEPLRQGIARVVYGSRYLRDDEFSKPAWRMFDWGVKLLNAFVYLLYGLRITDEATCYKAMSTSLLKSLRLRCERFEFCPEVTAKVCRAGIAIHEVPIRYESRTHAAGKKIGWRDGVTALGTLLYWRFAKYSNGVIEP